MKGEVSVLDENIFYTFLSNLVISGVISDIGSAENSLHRILSKRLQFNNYYYIWLCFWESALLPHTYQASYKIEITQSFLLMYKNTCHLLRRIRFNAWNLWYSKQSRRMLKYYPFYNCREWGPRNLQIMFWKGFE